MNSSRSSIYYRPRPVSPEDLALMRRIDELHLEMPYAGARMLSRILKREGRPVGRRRVTILMRRMDHHVAGFPPKFLKFITVFSSLTMPRRPGMTEIVDVQTHQPGPYLMAG